MKLDFKQTKLALRDLLHHHQAVGTSRNILQRQGHNLTLNLKNITAYPMTGSKPIQHFIEPDPTDASYVDDSQSPVFGSTGPVPIDVQQIYLNNCWEGCPEMGLASFSNGQKFLKSILQPSIDSSGNRIPGHWTNFMVVNSVYAAIDITMTVGNVQNQIGPNGNIWPDLMEKAMVCIIGGASRNLFSVLNFNVLSFPMQTLGLKNVRWLTNLNQAIAARQALGVATLATHANVPAGIVQNHAYAYTSNIWEQEWASQFDTDDGTGVYRHYQFNQQQINNGSMDLYVCDPVTIDPILPIPLPELAPIKRPPVITPTRPVLDFN